MLKELQETGIYILCKPNGGERVCVCTHTQQFNRTMKQKSDKSLHDQVATGSEGNSVDPRNPLLCWRLG